MYELIKHRVGAWALSPIINGDYSGLDDGDEVMLNDWIEWAQDDWTDSDGNTWLFSHWGSIDDHNEFAQDDITHYFGEVYTIDAVFKLKPRS